MYKFLHVIIVNLVLYLRWTDQLIRQYEQSPVKYDVDALEFQHAREIKQRQKVKRRSSLKTYKVSYFVFISL